MKQTLSLEPHHAEASKLLTKLQTVEPNENDGEIPLASSPEDEATSRDLEPSIDTIEKIETNQTSSREATPSNTTNGESAQDPDSKPIYYKIDKRVWALLARGNEVKDFGFK